MQAKTEIREVTVVEVDPSNMWLTYEKIHLPTREPHYPSEGNMQKCNGNANRIPRSTINKSWSGST